MIRAGLPAMIVPSGTSPETTVRGPITTASKPGGLTAQSPDSPSRHFLGRKREKTSRPVSMLS